jgi:hypothetical protein
MTDIERNKRALIAQAQALDPIDRQLRSKAQELRRLWNESGRCPSRTIDDELLRDFDGAINRVFAAPISAPRSLDETRSLARTLANELSRDLFLPVITEVHTVTRTGWRSKKEKHSVTRTTLFDGYTLYTRRMHEARYFLEGSGKTVFVSYTDLEIWLKRDGALVCTEAKEDRLLQEGVSWKMRTIAREQHLADPDCLFKERDIRQPGVQETFYEFERWRDGNPAPDRSRLGMIVRDLLVRERGQRPPAPAPAPAPSPSPSPSSSPAPGPSAVAPSRTPTAVAKAMPTPGAPQDDERVKALALFAGLLASRLRSLRQIPSTGPAPGPSAVAPTRTPTAVATAKPAVAADWYADPSGRFELRYWNGSAWTEHVALATQRFTDPPVA